MAYINESNGIGINLNTVEERFENIKEILKDVKINEDEILYYIGAISSMEESISFDETVMKKRDIETLLKNKDLLPMFEISKYNRIGNEIKTFIESMYFYHTITNAFTGGIYSSLITPLYYALSLYKGEEIDVPIYKENGYHIFFDETKGFSEEALMVSYKSKFTNIQRSEYVEMLPVGYLLTNKNLIKRTDEHINVFEKKMKHYYHFLLSYTIVMENVKFLDKKRKVYLPLINDSTNYLTRNVILDYEKEVEGDYAERTGKTLYNLKEALLNVKSLKEIFNTPLVELFEKKTDIYCKYEKENIKFILEVELPVENVSGKIKRLSNKDKNGKKTYNTYIVYNTDIPLKKVEETNIYSLLYQKNPELLHYFARMNTNDTVTYKLSNGKWVMMIKSGFNKVSYKYLNDKRIISDEYNYIYDSTFTHAEFKKKFGFDPLPAKSVIAKEVSRLIISRHKK